MGGDEGKETRIRIHCMKKLFPLQKEKSAGGFLLDW